MTEWCICILIPLPLLLAELIYDGQVEMPRVVRYVPCPVSRVPCVVDTYTISLNLYRGSILILWKPLEAHYR